ncbi:DUF4041 domain-containing protein [bacterium]|nr:DUF4041 domain-containing protein [bacterium]
MTLTAIFFVSAAIFLALFLKTNRTLTRVEAELRPLEKYRVVRDAEKRAQEILLEAERHASDIVERARGQAIALEKQAERLVEETKTFSEAKKREALNEAATLKANADAIVSQAKIEGERIVEAAQKHAREIAGDALDAKENADHYERTAKAMKNIVEGYGDRYLIPSYTLLDELADEFGFTEAGQKLKAAREQIRGMIKSGTAAACDYVEANRKETAVRFVLDAFNGKVEEILSRLKRDNHGTLAQQIKDACAVVNREGSAFRNARITPEYLQARLDELHWAAVANEIKLKEREEQRLLKERIREEERAQREFEKAVREAAKEEDGIRKAMEKMQKEVDKASLEQRAQFEAQLLDLQAKLAEAEARGQRALSMAQQTKSGHVYVISNVGSFGDHVYKIGMTRRLEPIDRIRELGDASVPFSFDVHALIQSDDAPGLERDIQKRFLRDQVNKVNPRKEFFRLALKDIREEVERMGLPVSWTVTAEAREFRETQAIELEMAKDKQKEREWIEHQLIAQKVMSIDDDAGEAEAVAS